MRIIFITILTFFMQIGEFLYGSIDYLLLSLFTLFGINYFLSLFIEIKNKTFKKRDIVLKTFKIFGYLSLITVSVFLDNVFKLDSIRKLILETFFINEVSCIFKHALALGLKVPDFLTNYLKKILDSMTKTIDP